MIRKTSTDSPFSTMSQVVWATNSPYGDVEANRVFAQIDGRLDGIPLKAHCPLRMLLQFRRYIEMEPGQW